MGSESASVPELFPRSTHCAGTRGQSVRTAEKGRKWCHISVKGLWASQSVPHSPTPRSFPVRSASRQPFLSLSPSRWDLPWSSCQKDTRLAPYKPHSTQQPLPKSNPQPTTLLYLPAALFSQRKVSARKASFGTLFVHCFQLRASTSA